MTDPTGGPRAVTPARVAERVAATHRPDRHGLVLIPLCDRSWRLCDRAVPPSDPASLVAYVEELADGSYEAVWVSVGLGCARYPSLEPLLAEAIDRLDQGRSLGALKPHHIPHRPPARV